MMQTAMKVPATVFGHIERSIPVPLYSQMASTLEGAIRDGVVPAGARLDNETVLCAQTGLSRLTVRRALQELVNKGLIVRGPGTGTRVAAGHFSRRPEFADLHEEIGDGESRILTLAINPADEHTAAQLGISTEDMILHMTRLRIVNGSPVAILDNALLGDFADLDGQQVAQRGLHRALSELGTTLKVARLLLGARQPTKNEARLLQLPSQSVVLTLERISFDGSGRAIEHARHCYRPDSYSFDLTIVKR